jgi:hypothetical protein
MIFYTMYVNLKYQMPNNTATFSHEPDNYVDSSTFSNEYQCRVGEYVSSSSMLYLVDGGCMSLSRLRMKYVSKLAGMHISCPGFSQHMVSICSEVT